MCVCVWARQIQTEPHYWPDCGGISGALSWPDRLTVDLDTVGAATVDTGRSSVKEVGFAGINTGTELPDSMWAPATGGCGEPAV